MKLILSRKGFDSESGGIPSPILPCGKAVSLPIPATKSPIKLKDLRVDGYDLNKIISDIGRSKINTQQYVHLDPDIDQCLIENRPNGWRGAFGQVAQAQSHLAKNNVGIGDIFIYFGWFKEIELKKGSWRFKPTAPDLHVIYGWLLVDEVLPVYRNEQEILNKYEWLGNHPHLYGIDDPRNTIYIGKEHLPNTISLDTRGYGVFDHINDAHILTDKDQNKRSIWKLPSCFLPEGNKPPLSYHGNRDRWRLKGDKWVVLQSVGRGQEFILDTRYAPGVTDWINELFR